MTFFCIFLFPKGTARAGPRLPLGLRPGVFRTFRAVAAVGPGGAAGGGAGGDPNGLQGGGAGPVGLVGKCWEYSGS